MKHVLVLLLSLFSLCAAPTAADAGARILPDSVAATARTEERRPCVRGRVEDTEGRPVPGVAVVMLDADSAYVAAAASDAEGRFEIVPAVKPYRLLFQHISYELAALSGESGEAGTVTLHERSTEIGAVVVEGERPVVRIEQGRLAYDLQVVVRGKAVNNAYEALTQLPGVSERQGTLTLAGTGSVTVILNGRPTTMDAAQPRGPLLRSTPVERIEKGGDHVQRTAAVPRTRRGDQPRHAPRRRRDSHGRGARRLLEPLLRQLGDGRQPRLRGARMVGRHHLFGGTDPVETAHRPAFEAYARRRNVRHRTASGPRQRDDRTPAARLGGVRPGEQGACQRGLHGIVHATQCGRFAGGGQLRPLVEPPRRRRSDAQPRSALHDRVGNGPRARLYALPDGRPGRHAQRIRRRHEAGFRRRVGTADRPPQLPASTNGTKRARVGR